MTGYRILIPDWHPATVNKLLDGHWSKAGRLKKADFKIIWTYSRQIPPAVKKRIVNIKLHIAGAGRTADPDAYFKSVLDALVRCKLLRDDSATWCQLGDVEFERGYVKATEIELVDL